MNALIIAFAKALAALWLFNRGTRHIWQRRFIGDDLADQGVGRLDTYDVVVTIEIIAKPKTPLAWVLPNETVVIQAAD